MIYNHQYWRLVTSALFHGGFMHIAFNMMSTLALAGSLERSVGTVQLVFVILWQIIVCGSFSVAASYCLTMFVFDDPSYMKQQSVGFSGVIFALAVVDIYRSGGGQRSVMGLFSVPAKYYPWVLLVVLQVRCPSSGDLRAAGWVIMWRAARWGLQLLTSRVLRRNAAWRQVLIPNISFLGHLSGILMGTVQAHGGLDCLLPSVRG